MPPLAPFKLERFFARHEFNVRYLLCASDCETVSLRELLATEPGAQEALGDLRLGYTHSQGSHELRSAIADLYTSVDPDQVLVHTGAEEAIFCFMQGLLSPGDHIIVHTPCYQSLTSLAESIGCRVTRWPGCEQRGWALDLDFLADALEPDTKAVVINCPHNPTGYLMGRTDFESVVARVRSHGAYLFSDEVYRLLEHNPADRLPTAADLYERAVSLGVTSKAFGLAGLRIGWVATKDDTIRQAMAQIKDYTTICSGAMSEQIAALALRQRASLLERNNKLAVDNLALANQFFERHTERFNWQPPKAGVIAFPAWQGDGDTDQLCHQLIESTGVLILPSSQYNAGAQHFRIGFGRKNFPQALARFEAYVDQKMA